MVCGRWWWRGYNGCGWQQLSAEPPCLCVQSPLSPLPQHAWAPLLPFSRQSLPHPPTRTSPLLFLLSAAAHLILKVFSQNQSERQRKRERASKRERERAPGGNVLVWWNPRTHPARKTHRYTHANTPPETLFPLSRSPSLSLSLSLCECLLHTEHFFHLKTRNIPLMQSEIPQHWQMDSFWFVHWHELKQKQVTGNHTDWGSIHGCLYWHIHAGRSSVRWG